MSIREGDGDSKFKLCLEEELHMGEQDALRKQIRENMELLATDDLQRIWSENDRAAWSDMAFDIIEQLLRERTGQAPGDQERPAAEGVDTLEAEDDDETYYALTTVERVSRWADIGAWVVLAGSLLAWLVDAYSTFSGTQFGNIQLFITSGGATRVLVGGFQSILNGVYLFVILKVIAQALLIMLDIEENTRGLRQPASAAGRAEQ